MNPSSPDWQAIRQEFPTTEKFTYLNIANKALLPRSVEHAMQAWMSDIYDNAGANAFSMAEVESARDVIAHTYGAPRDSLALIKNTSEGVNIVAQGFPWRDGDNVVISDFEHENNTFPWRHLARRGVEIRFASPGPDGRITVDQYRDIVDQNTRILAVGWVVYGNGYRADLAKIAEFCRERDVKLVVDGIQALGILNEPVAHTGADVLIAGGHKAQLGLAGAGLMYVTPAMNEMLTPPYAAKFSFSSLDRTVENLELAGDAHRFEYGNPNFLGIWVQQRSAQFIASIGLQHIEDRVRSLTTRLIEGAQARQLKVRTPKDWAERAGIVSLDLGRDASATVAALAERQVVVSQKDGHLRAAIHFYNNEADIDRFLEALSEA